MSNHRWCRTVDDKEIDLFNPDPALFTVDRIAHALARITRFAGLWRNPISVARHSIRVADLLRDAGHDVDTQLQGLFHDAAEAFTTDIPTPLKKLLHVRNPREPYRGGDSFMPYSKFEDVLLDQIFDVLEIEWPLRLKVHAVDKQLTEQECNWVKVDDTVPVAVDSQLYPYCLSTDPEAVARVFENKAEALFAERERATVNGDSHK